MPELFLAAVFSVIPVPPTQSSAARALRLLPDYSPTINRVAPSSGIPGEPATLQSLGFRNDGRKLSMGRDLSLDIASINSKVVLIGADSYTPLRRTGWESEESLKLPFNRTFFVVGKLGADSGSLEQQQYKVNGATGLGVRLPYGGELLMRRGRSMTNYDPDDLALVPERSKDYFELSTKWTLPGDVKLEYTQEQIAPQTPLGRDKVKRDVRFAYPLPNSGQIHVGAKYESPDTATPTPWIDRMKLYLGLQLKR